MAGTIARRAPYKDFLQPALQRRFSLTAAILLAVSYVEALLLADWSSFVWSWFPLGPTGIRTAGIFVCGLAILVLRIAHYHVGRRTITPGTKVLATCLSSLATYETSFWYCFSSFAYSVLYLWTVPKSANLRWIVYFSGDRARLNERPIFFIAYMLVLAVLQTWAHYEQDMDRLDLKLKRRDEKEKASGDLGLAMADVSRELPPMLNGTIVRAIYALPATFILYHALFRGFAWSWTLLFFRPFYNLPKTNMVPANWPSDLFLFARCMYGGVLVSILWATGNVAFSASMAREPLKNGKALTSESKDPNGSLLTGLKSKKDTVKAFAMWELAQIAEEDPVRRQAIFQDIDRKDGPMWSQVYAISMELLRGIETRIDDFGKPPPAPAPESATIQPKPHVAAPLRDDPIFANRPASASIVGGVKKAVNKATLSPGSSPAKQLSPLARKSWAEAKDRILTKEQQEQLTPGHVKDQFGQVALQMAAVPRVGDLLREDFATRFAAVVFGSPYADPTVYLHACQALCHLAVQSLGEDQYGNVHRDVPSIIRTLTSVIRKTDAFRERFPLHWSDVNGVKESPDVSMVLRGCRTGLQSVVTAFEPFSTDLRLTLGDLRHAKEAAAEPEVEVEVQKPVVQAKATGRERIEASADDKRPERRRLEPQNGRVEMEQVRASGRAVRA